MSTHTQQPKQLFQSLGKKIILLSLNGWEFECNPAIIVKTHSNSLCDAWLQHHHLHLNDVCLHLLLSLSLHIHLGSTLFKSVQLI